MSYTSQCKCTTFFLRKNLNGLPVVLKKILFRGLDSPISEEIQKDQNGKWNQDLYDEIHARQIDSDINLIFP